MEVDAESVRGGCRKYSGLIGRKMSLSVLVPVRWPLCPDLDGGPPPPGPSRGADLSRRRASTHFEVKFDHDQASTSGVRHGSQNTGEGAATRVSRVSLGMSM